MADRGEANLPKGVGWTALLVARARANESRRPDRLFEDPLADAFVRAGGEALAKAEQSLPGGDAGEVNRWREDAVALRTSFLDGVVTQACASGCRQVVLLAAGLDARAFRLPWPAGVRLFEVEMPDVLAFKERVLRDVGGQAACERIVVPADLSDPDWRGRLRNAGLDPERPAAWLIEGLLMYLAEPERDRLLHSVKELAAPGSWLGLDHRPGFFATPALPGAEAGQIPAARADDASLLDPKGWLARHGWEAEISRPVELFERNRRPVPPPLRAEAPGGPQSWTASARRV